MSHNHTDNSNELLSAYIDGAVDAVERRRAEQYIASCAACAYELQELRMFRELLRDLPTVQPRRSFTLDPAAVAPPRRLLFPTLRWSSLVATLLFLVVLGVDVLGGGSLRQPMVASQAEPAQKSPAAQFDGSGAAGGSAETMMMPQASPAASVGADQAAPEAATAPLMAELPPVQETSVASDAVPEASPAVGGYPPRQATAAASEAPAMARNAESPAPLTAPAGGAADQLPQSGFRADQPAAADTIDLADGATAQGSWWSSYTIRIVEVGLGVIALLLGGAAIWTWRRQM